MQATNTTAKTCQLAAVLRVEGVPTIRPVRVGRLVRHDSVLGHLQTVSCYHQCQQHCSSMLLPRTQHCHCWLCLQARPNGSQQAGTAAKSSAVLLSIV